MSRSEAELTLVLRARNLATQALQTVETAIERVRTKAGQIAGAFRTAFAGLGGVLGMAVSGLVYDLGHGATVQEAFRQFGVTCGLLAAEAFILNMGSTIAAKVAGSAIVEKIGVQLAILGATMGGIVDTAMGVAMAALPFVLIAAIIAAIVVLITNEDIRNKVFAFAGEVLTNIQTGLNTLGAKLVEWVGGAFDWLIKNIGPFVAALVKAIIDGLASLPGKMADIIRAGLTVESSGASGGGAGKFGSPVPRQGGGWIGQNGPELMWGGEHGPEYVHPRHGGGGGPQTIILQVGAHEVARFIVPAVSSRMMYEAQRAAPTLGRT